jgi:hypothetical protein
LPRISHSDRIKRRSEILSGWPTTRKVAKTGCLCETSLRRSRGCAPSSGPLHSSRGHLVSFADHKVTFRWRDSAHNEQRLMTLSLDEFLRRFMLHLLPDSFVRIRNFGFLPTCAGPLACLFAFRCSARHRQQSKTRQAPRTRTPLIFALIYLDAYMLCGVYQESGICVRNHCGAESPRDIEPPGLVTTVGRDRASTSYAAADRVKAPASAARGRFRRIDSGCTAPSLSTET